MMKPALNELKPATNATELDVEVLKQFRVIFKSVRKHFQAVEDAVGITGAQLWALSAVAANPGLKVSALAKALALHQSTTSNLVEKLVEADLVRRERSSKDGRLISLYVTDTGLDQLSRAPGPVKGLLPDALERLPYRTLRDLNDALNLLLGTMKELEANAGETTPLSDL